MLNERMGGTWDVPAKREAAWRIVPSPPKVAVMSIFRWREGGSDVKLGEAVKRGKGRESWIDAASDGSTTSDMEG